MGWFGSRNDNDINDFLQKNQPKYDPSIQVEKTQFNVEQPATPPVQTTKSTQISTETAQKVLAQRSIINSTALDNCEEFHIQLQECFLHGKWYDRAARMCEPQKQKFWQCVNDQKKYLHQHSFGNPAVRNQSGILLDAQNLPTAPSTKPP